VIPTLFLSREREVWRQSVAAKVTKFDVVILAGAPNRGSLTEVSSATWEALVTVASRPMVEYVIDTMLTLENVGKVVLVGPEELRETSPSISFTLCKDSLVDNLKAGIDALGADKSPYTLIVTSDIPLISTEAVNDFIDQCLKHRDAKAFYPLVSREVNEASYPEVQRTYFPLKEGTFTGGNIMLLDPNVVETHFELIRQLTDLRKSPAKIVKRLGRRFLVKFITKSLSIEEIEQRAEEILGFKAKAIISTYPEIGIDVDKPSDLYLMENLFAETH